jgi:DNA adenine methylase
MDVDSSNPRSALVCQPRSTTVATSANLQHVLVKWTGSKRRQARQIVAKFPRRIATYYEPLLGGGSVLYELLASDVEVECYEVSDICQPLIGLWQLIKSDPRGLVEEYTKNWRLLRVRGPAQYYEVRQEFNESQNPHLFFFLLRTCRFGHVRFNQAGKFNGSFHPANLGMAPERVQLLAETWHRRLASKNVTFYARDYRGISTTAGDVLYLDPPYQTGNARYYRGRFNYGEFFDWLRSQQGDHFLSLNGFLGDDDRRLEVAADLYDRHRLLANGENPFDRLDGRSRRLVTESLYIKSRSSSPKAVVDVPQPERPRGGRVTCVMSPSRILGTQLTLGIRRLLDTLHPKAS